MGSCHSEILHHLPTVSNQVAGVLIAVSALVFDFDCITEVWAAKRALARGRVGAIRLRNSEMDVCFYVAYPPPGRGRPCATYVAVFDELAEILNSSRMCPSRCLPIGAIDVNGHNGLQKGTDGAWRTSLCQNFGDADPEFEQLCAMLSALAPAVAQHAPSSPCIHACCVDRAHRVLVAGVCGR